MSRAARSRLRKVSQTVRDGSISIIGLGKLGASMAAAIAAHGYNVIGVDVLDRAVSDLNAGRAPVQETGLDDLVAANQQRLRGTTNVEEAVSESSISFVVVPTPSDDRGAFSLRYATEAFRHIGAALANKSEYHLVVLTSTVLPGGTRYGLLPILEQESGKKAGRDFGVCYSPEFIALGTVLRDFQNPDFTLIGEFDDRSGEMLEQFYVSVLDNGAPSKRMSIENAELTKISINTYVTMKITYANMIADLCERIPGGDIEVVSDAIGSDARIGRKYLSGGLGYGGPCFPRDNVALAFLSRTLGGEAGLAEMTDSMNRAFPHRWVDRLRKIAPSNGTVAVLGLSYKPMSHVVEESQAIQIANAIAKAGFSVVAFDPLANQSARKVLDDKVQILDSVEACLQKAAVVVIATPDPAFRGIGPEHLKGSGTVAVVDFWRLLDGAALKAHGVNYVAAGTALDETASQGEMRLLWSPEGGSR
ncbi:MAG: nucleotide sugar dehydrogenase [Actinomycetota bacterium]